MQVPLSVVGEKVGEIAFKVPAVPVAQPRPRAVTIRGHARMANVPKDKPIHAFKASVRMAFEGAYSGPPLDELLAIELVFVMERPQRLIWKTKPMPRTWYESKKNDWDNLGKAVCDALNGLAYRDDGQIVHAVVKRIYAAGNEQPHVWVSIRPVAPLRDDELEGVHAGLAVQNTAR